MRKIRLTSILFLGIAILPGLCLGATYYVNPGESIQAAVDQAGPGDTILIRGGRYHEFIELKSSGLEGEPITLKAYPGETPIITGAKFITGWTQCVANEPGLTDIDGVTNPNYANIYKATVAAADVPDIKQLMLFEDNNFLSIAQEPNQSHPFIDHVSEYTPVTDPVNNWQREFLVHSSFTQSDDYWKGAFIRMYLYTWKNLGQRTVSSFNAVENKMTFDTSFGNNIVLGAGRTNAFILMNHPSLIDYAGEYYYTTTAAEGTYTVYLWPRNISNLDGNISFAKEQHCIESVEKGYWIIDGIAMRGTANNAIQQYNPDHMTIQNCIIENLVGTGINHYGAPRSSNAVTNCTIRNTCGRSGAYISDSRGMVIGGSNSVITNNNVYDTYNNPILLKRASMALIADNIIGGYSDSHASYADGNVIDNGGGIVVDSLSSDILIARNLVVSEGMPIGIYNSSNITIFGNVIVRTNGEDYAIKDLGGLTGNINVLNNTIYTMPPSSHEAIYIVSYGNPSYVYNNIIYGGGNIRNDSQRDYNIYTRLVDWQMQNNWKLNDHEMLLEGEENSIFLNYNNAITLANYDKNLMLKSGSPAIDAGMDISSFLPTEKFPDFDFAGCIYGLTKEYGSESWDIGANLNTSYVSDPNTDPEPNDPEDPIVDPPVTEPEADDATVEKTVLSLYNNVLKSGGNSQATIHCDMKEPGNLSVKVYDSKGREIVVLFNGQASAGRHEFTWSAAGVGSGIYMVHMRAGSFERAKKIAVIK